MNNLSRRDFGFGALACASGQGSLVSNLPIAEIGQGLRLCYVERGAGAPLVFVHGSLSDYTYWGDQLAFFSDTHRVVAYSRRYNWPNVNPARRGYSAIADADDLARLLTALNIEAPVIIGHSYGALAALFFAIRYPARTRALVLAEPPAISLLDHIEGPNAQRARAMHRDIQARMIGPMRADFRRGETEAGVAQFINYVFNDTSAWANLSAIARAETLRDAHEWEVMLPHGTLFPELPPSDVRAIVAPILMFSGARSYPFLTLTDGELERLLPQAERLIIPDVGHQMWLQRAEFCQRHTARFLSALHA